MSAHFQQIRSKIKEACRDLKEISGSQLGFKVGKDPDYERLKQEYGNLRAFIESECLDFLSFLRKSGGDVVYAVTNMAPEEPPLITDGQIIWRAFTNPNSRSSIYYFRDREELVVAPGMFSAPAIRFQRIAPISDDEQIKMIAEFAKNSLTIAHQQLISGALAEQNYWWIVTGIIKNLGNDVEREFYSSRKRTLINILRERLIVILGSKDKANYTINRLDQDDPDQDVESDSKISDLKSRLKILIETMTNEEAEKIVIPLSVVSDMFSRLRGQ